jgi:K+-transporting ATPase c subunit
MKSRIFGLGIPAILLALGRVFVSCDNPSSGGGGGSEKVAIPTATPQSGPVAYGTGITLETATAGATIYYTTNGNTPTTASTQYSNTNKPTITAATTIAFIAVKEGMDNSDIVTADFTISTGGPGGDNQVVMPTATPQSGPVTAGTEITLATATVGATIYYTTDGTPPSGSSTQYSDTNKPTITAATTITFIAVKEGMENSGIVTADFTISTGGSGGDDKVAKPTATPQAGAVAANTEITLATATDGATIYYTTNGNTPTTASTQYSDTNKPTITAATTIKAIAVKDGMDNSDVLEAAYTISTGGNNNGSNPPDNRGFLEILYGETSDDDNFPSGEGVYVGIISFADDARVISDPERLNYGGYMRLKNHIDSDYTRASSGSTSLFLAVHKALAELKKNESSYPDKLDTVSIITFTDGLDNRSLAMLANPENSGDPNYHLEGKTYDVSKPESAIEYHNYIKGEINNRKIANHPIKAYAVGVEAEDVGGDTASFEASLAKIASEGKDESGVSYVTKLTNFAQLKETFQNIAEGLNVTHTSVNIVMTTTQSDAGTTYRWTFDNVVNANSVGSSTKYIEATIAVNASGNYSLTNITYAGGIATAQGNGPLTGTANSAGNVDFTFTDVTGHDPETGGKPKQWIKRYGSTVWTSESEIDSTGNANTNVEQKTAIIYLVLDASTSLTEADIASIKSAISSTN